MSALSNSRLVPAVRLCAVVVVAVGGLVLVGWGLDLSALKRVFPDLVTMKANTALGFIMCGTTLALASRIPFAGPARLAAIVLASGAILLGALSLGENVFGWDLGIDQWLFLDPPHVGQTSPGGRMSPVTSLLFLIAGNALLLGPLAISEKIRHAAQAALAASVTIIAGLALLFYLFEALFALHPSNYTGMALHTAAAFLLLGFGLLLLVRREGGLTWSLDRLSTAGFAIGILSLFAAAGASYNFTAQLVRAASWVTHTQAVLKDLELFATHVDLLGSSQRSYVNSGDEHSLDPYEQASASFKPDLATLRALTSDNPRQQSRLDQLDALVRRRLEWGQQVIAARRLQGLSAAEQIVTTSSGIALTNDIRRLIREMNEEEYSLLDEREKTANEVSTTTFHLLPLGAFLSLTILSLGLFFLNLGINERKAADDRANLDSAERKRAETSAARLAALVETSDDAIIGKDLRGVVTSWNSGAEKVFGFPASEMVGQSITRLIPPDRQMEEVDILQRIGRGESIRHFETVRLRRDGSLIDVSVTVSAIKDSDGRIIGASKVARNISEQKTAEATILRLNSSLEQRVFERTVQLEAANQELEAFSYSVSHDLRAPLRAMDGFSQAVLEDFGPQLPDEAQRYLQTIRQSAQRMGALIDDLLAFARFNRKALSKRPIDTGNLVRETLGELGSPWAERTIELRIGDLPACSADPALLKQVWLNLLSNALKYTRRREKAEVEIGATKINGHETFFVRDNGTGFDMRYADKLFGVFQRLHRLEDYEGTGVGLAIVQRIVHRHGGRVWAEAAPDRGATFFFTLEENPSP